MIIKRQPNKLNERYLQAATSQSVYQLKESLQVGEILVHTDSSLVISFQTFLSSFQSVPVYQLNESIQVGDILVHNEFFHHFKLFFHHFRLFLFFFSRVSSYCHVL